MTVYLITGANRGLGLEFVKQLNERDARIFAACRTPDDADELNEIAAGADGRITVVALDVTAPETLQTAVETIAAETDHLDVLINNAGYFDKDEAWGNLNRDTMTRHFQINTIGPMLLTQAAVDLLRAGGGGLVTNITSQLGSIDNRRGTEGGYSYNSSKAALNMLTKMSAAELRPHNIITLAVHPGWVQTDMGGQAATLTPTESVGGILQVMDGATMAHSGRFVSHNGDELPW